MLQVQATFAGGLQEHLQAAGGANAATAASLRESLGASAQILNQLKSQKGVSAFCLMLRWCQITRCVDISTRFGGVADLSTRQHHKQLPCTPVVGSGLHKFTKH